MKGKYCKWIFWKMNSTKGRTYCVNPGSEYAEGILKAFLVEFKGDKIIKLQKIEG